MTISGKPGFLAAFTVLFALLACIGCSSSDSPTDPGGGGTEPGGGAPADWSLTVVDRPEGGWGWAVWAVATDLAYAGAGPDVLVWDGSGWRPSLHAGNLFVHDMFALGADAVYAVGTRLYRYDGVSWSEMTLPAPCWSIWGTAEDDLWACGNAHVYHWDGAAWTTMAVGSYTLWSLWGSGPDDVFVVGNAGEIFHWDGDNWTAMTSGTTANLWDVWGFAANDVWAAGPTGGVLHWDGADWTLVASSGAARALWGAAAGDLWALASATSLMHWDGAAWSTPVDIDGLDLQSLDGAGGQVFAGGNSVGLQEGGVWTRQLWTSADGFVDVGGSGATNLVAVAGRNFWAWDGTGWSSTYLSSLQYVAHAVWSGAPGQDVVTCYGGIAYRNGGGAWQYQSVDTDDVRCAWGTAAGGVWLGCNNGKLYHTDGTAAPVLTQTAVNFTIEGLFGLADDSIWAVGGSGTLLHYDGAAWTAQTSSTPFDLFAVWATAADDLWVAGDNGLCRHWDGSGWLDYDFTQLDINQLLGWASDGLLAVGDGGVFRFDGDGWTAVAGADVFDIEAVHLAPDGATLAVDQAGWLYKGLPE